MDSNYFFSSKAVSIAVVVVQPMLIMGVGVCSVWQTRCSKFCAGTMGPSGTASATRVAA